MLKKKPRYKPLYKKFIRLRKNIQNKEKINKTNFKSRPKDTPLACKILISFSEYMRPKVNMIPIKKANGNASSKNSGIL